MVTSRRSAIRPLITDFRPICEVGCWRFTNCAVDNRNCVVEQFQCFVATFSVVFVIKLKFLLMSAAFVGKDYHFNENFVFQLDQSLSIGSSSLTVSCGHFGAKQRRPVFIQRHVANILTSREDRCVYARASAVCIRIVFGGTCE